MITAVIQSQHKGEVRFGMRGVYQWAASWTVLAMLFGGGPSAAEVAIVARESVVVPSPARALVGDRTDVVASIVDADEINSQPTEPAPPPPPRAPDFVCPVAAPVAFTDDFGAARSGGRRHMGSDLTAPSGTPTVAPVAGTVRFDRDGAGGLSWHLTAPDGVYYYGTHLSAFGPRSGWVEQGEVIGYVGMTGNASVNHLHFEIRPGGINSVAVNATPKILAACEINGR